MNPDTLVSVHGYSGDQRQIEELMPMYEHHGCPIVICSPIDSPITNMGPHICRQEGLVGYIGQRSLDRQWMQMRALLEFRQTNGEPFKWFLMNDSDSFVITPKLPDYLYKDGIVWSNEVNDFRRPGESWQGQPPWPNDYHAGMPLIAMQPPYFLSRACMEKMVSVASQIKMCPICPFIDWYIVQLTVAARLEHRPFIGGASCETKTALGKLVMQECISQRNATFLHSIKSGDVMRKLVDVYNKSRG